MRSLRTKKLQTNVKNIILSFILHNFAKNCGSVPTNDILMLQTTILAMRKTYMTATLIAVAAMAGCNTPPRHVANGQETERFRTDTTVSLTQGVSPECRLTLDVEYMKGAKGAPTNRAILRSGIFPPEYIDTATAGGDMEKAMRELAGNCIAAYRADYAPLFKADRSEAALYEKSVKATGRMTPARGTIVAYTLETTEQTGDNPPVKLTRAVNIDTAKARRITLADVLKHGSERFVTKMITRRLCRKFHAKDIGELRSKGVLALTDAYIPDNFIIGKDRITFIFNPDEIAPHDAGEIRIDISDSELGTLLKTE